MAKKLTLNELRKLNKQFEKSEKITVGGYDIDVYINFSSTRMNKLIQNYINTLGILEKEKIDNFHHVPYFMYLLIKHFSSFGDQFVDKPYSLQHELKIMNLLIDNGFFNEIIENYPMEEINKLIEQIKTINENANFIFGNVDVSEIVKQEKLFQNKAID